MSALDNKVKQSVLPRWRGFNLTDMMSPVNTGSYQATDFEWISDFGFDFVRLPVNYLGLLENGNLYEFNESALEKLDYAINLGMKHQIHINLNLHRAPGYCVYYGKGPFEPFSLWKDKEAQDAFCYYWEMFAKRYQGIDSKHLSFNLVNEPHEPDEENMTREDHSRVMRAAVKAIENIDANRLIILDGLKEGILPCPELTDMNVSQSCRAYYPYGVSHYNAEWAWDWLDWNEVPPPAWPGGWNYGEIWDRDRLYAFYQPWIELAQNGTGVICGEGGAYRYTPHNIALSWLEDVFTILKDNNIGWALWNFRGSFGILDSQRTDIEYEDWYGHSLDRKMLDLLQKS